MAKIVEELIIIKLSKLVKDNEQSRSHTVNNDMLASLEAVVQELIGSDVIVEVSTDNVN
jgi:hypothetical protein